MLFSDRDFQYIDTYVASPSIQLKLFDFLKFFQEVHIFYKFNWLQNLLQICYKTRNINIVVLGQFKGCDYRLHYRFIGHKIEEICCLQSRYFVLIYIWPPEVRYYSLWGRRSISGVQYNAYIDFHFTILLVRCPCVNP